MWSRRTTEGADPCAKRTFGSYSRGDKQPHQPDWRKADVAVWSYPGWMPVFWTYTRQVLRNRRRKWPPCPWRFSDGVRFSAGPKGGADVAVDATLTSPGGCLSSPVVRTCRGLRGEWNHPGV